MIEVQIPQNILDINNRLFELCSQGYNIRVEDAAKLSGMHHESLRESIYRGQCPFAIGFSPQKTSTGSIIENGLARIPVLAFYNFMTQGMIYKSTWISSQNEKRTAAGEDNPCDT